MVTPSEGSVFFLTPDIFQVSETLGIYRNKKGSDYMGEVSVEIILTNSADQAMVREGYKKDDEIRTMKVKALVDTGSVSCVLTPFVADRLGLARVFRHMAQYADGRREEVGVTEPVMIEIEGRRTYEECLILGDEVLIGQTALEKTDLMVDCRQKKVFPNPDHPHQPVIKIRFLA